MKLSNLKNFTRGWIVGKFNPSLFQQDHELGIKYYDKGDSEQSHCHLLSDEITILVTGIVEMNGQLFSEGDIIVQEKGEYTDFKVVSDKAITVVYRPDGSFPQDKHFK